MNNLALNVFRSRMVKMVSVIVVCLLLIGSGYWVRWAFSNPVEEKKDAVVLTYQHNGKFDHQVYADPRVYTATSQPEEAKSVYFTKLIKSVDVIFDYKFLFEEPLKTVNTTVSVSAVLENPGMWQYEIVLMPTTQMAGQFTTTFPLDTAQFGDLLKTIGDEIGVRAMSPYITIKANVHTEAETRFGVLRNDFSQTAKVKLTDTVMEWDKELSRAQRGLYNGLRYEHQGVFDYSIKLGPSILYGDSATIESKMPAPEPPVAIPHALSYQLDKIDSMDVMFSYNLDSKEKLERVTEEVNVTALLENPGFWSQSFDLVSKREETGDNFSVKFPLDLQQFTRVIAAKQKEMRVIAQAHNLIINAEVHTTALSKFGSIDEVFSQNLKLSLGSTTVGVTEDVAKSQPSSLTGTTTVRRPGVEQARRWSPIVLGVVVLIFLFILWNVIMVRPERLSASEAEYVRARKKYKNVIIDVEKLPELRFTETVVPLSSLEGLIATADSLLKPVFHKYDMQGHAYCVIDGTTRYEYMSRT